ncbi:MFS transporter [Actinoalloteichus hymeniacidonis]|uniref:MFS transporter n=1 Tax=Actinoalloteichus hymeniacidonis TaxID=340345 RepID=UPI0017C9A136|nr:MFS transporter [Actinoalloteichus hymeniacidonis]MBB5908487.1 putative MFS family arabinose efflux permease [Actinoalloteichus hymeniacidonis]
MSIGATRATSQRTPPPEAAEVQARPLRADGPIEQAEQPAVDALNDRPTSTSGAAADSPAATAPKPSPEESARPAGVPSDLRMARVLWPLLVASAVSLLPFTVFSTFLVAIAAYADTSVAEMGGLRGLGGLASLVVGAVLAPLIDRMPRDLAAAGGLVLLGAAAALGAIGHYAALVAFCFLIGAATSVVSPALATAAADRFDSPAAAGRAATLVTATQSLTAMLAAPLVVAPGLIWGWQGNLLAVAVIAVVLAALLVLRSNRLRHATAASAAPRLGYFASFRALAAVRTAVPLLLIAALRTAAFMGYLAYLAPFYDERFDLAPGPFAFVWTLSGATFFVGNLLTGRFANRIDRALLTERVLLLGLLVATLSMAGFYLSRSLPAALICTAALGVAHAVIAACVVSLLVRRCPENQRGAALTVNAAGMSLGVFIGAALGGAGLSLAGYPGVGAVLGGLTLIALVLGMAVHAGAKSAAPGQPTG